MLSAVRQELVLARGRCRPLPSHQQQLLRPQPLPLLSRARRALATKCGDAAATEPAKKPDSVFERFSKFSRVTKSDPAMGELLNTKGGSKGGEMDAKAKALAEDDPDDFVEMFNPDTREWNGPRFGEPTKFGDWAHKGRATDFH
jgi:hypothetical protein